MVVNWRHLLGFFCDCDACKPHRELQDSRKAAQNLYKVVRRSR